jgi:hypothetical protein
LCGSLAAQDLQCRYAQQCAWCEGGYRLRAHAEDLTSPAAACVRDACEVRRIQKNPRTFIHRFSGLLIISVLISKLE